MGFYSPATIVDDAKRAGVVVLPIDINKSSWHCTLEPQDDKLAVRMGIRYVQGLGSREEKVLTQRPGPYADLETFVRQSRFSIRSYTQMAEAGAFESFGLSRRDAVWAVKELVTRLGDSLDLSSDTNAESQPSFRPLPPAGEIFWDYRTSHHSARGHPMMSARLELRRQKIPDSKTLNAMPDGSRTQYVGMVICRQQPGTATGITFYTLEDECGFVNLVVWHDTFLKYNVLARTALLIGVTGKIQSESGVVHLIAEKLWDPGIAFHPEGTTTRSFH
jgi:error-prone DNA polymerase